MKSLLALLLFLSSPALAQTTVTMGDTAVETAADSGNANLVIAQQATLAQAGTLQSLSFYVTTAGGQMYLAVFSDNGGKPGTLLGQTAVFTPATGWNTKPTTTAPSLPAGTYWLVYAPSSNTLAFRKQNNSGNCSYFPRTFQALPTGWPTAGVLSCTPTTWSFYATVTTAAPPPVNTALPTISGTAQVGQTLTVTNGTWSGSPTSYLYQWNSAGTAISGATSSSYVVQFSDIGNQLTVTVTAINAAGKATTTTAPTVAVSDVLTGTYTQGSTSGTASCTETDPTHVSCVLTPPLANTNNLTVGPVQ